MYECSEELCVCNLVYSVEYKVNILFMLRPVVNTFLVKLQDLFFALKDVLAGEASLQKTSQLLLLFSQCLSSSVACLNNVSQEEQGRVCSPPLTDVLELVK